VRQQPRHGSVSCEASETLVSVFYAGRLFLLDLRARPPGDAKDSFALLPLFSG
jgi:hypothetical protein